MAGGVGEPAHAAPRRLGASSMNGEHWRPARHSTTRRDGRRSLESSVPACVIVVLAMLGCASTHIENLPLEQYRPGVGYGATPVHPLESDDLHVVLLFSGGGTRAASLAYGVLTELRRTDLTLGGRPSRMLDHVSTISSVSGGSFTAAYYGLYGDRVFYDFEDRFLRRDIDARLGLSLLRPFELLRVMFTGYTRSDMAADLYDRELFDRATFADLEVANGPLLSINATDLDVGAVFTFVQQDFDLICSDLSKLRVAQAATASSAVPGIFAPLLLENFAGTCGMPEPEWIEQGLAHPRHSRRRHHEAMGAATYLDRNARPYIALVDGGVADNIGARRVISELVQVGDAAALEAMYDSGVTRNVLYVIVNAQVGGKKEKRQKPRLPAVTDVASLVSGVSIYRYNFETIELLRETVAKWQKELADLGQPVNAAVVEVAFENLPDGDEREWFNEIETSFNLDDETVDRLIEVGGRLLRDSDDFRDFLETLD